MDAVLKRRRGTKSSTTRRMIEETAARMFTPESPADPKAVAEWVSMQARQSALDCADFARRLLARKTTAEQLLGELLLNAAALALSAMNTGDWERLAGAVELISNHAGGK